MNNFKVNLVKCLSDNYSYIIFNPNSKKSIVVDPAEAEPVAEELEKLNLELEYILITHHHSDHVGGNLELKKKYNCKIVGYENDADRIPGIDIRLNDKEIFYFENEEIELNTGPGHTSGHIFYFFKKNQLAFVGDIVFSLGCGRIFEGTAEEMHSSVTKIKSLPDLTKIYCGHEYTENNLKFCKHYDPENNDLIERGREIFNLRKKNLPTIPTTVLLEKRTNIFFRCDNNIISFNLNMKGSNPSIIFKKLRELKDNF